jgi:hypothetical protein
MKKMSGSTMLAGLTNKCPPGDSGMRPPKGSVNDGTTRDSTASGHTIGGRTA